MAGARKRKWGWSSKSTLASKPSKKHLALENTGTAAHGHHVKHPFTGDMSIDSRSSELMISESLVSKLRHNGTKILSLVGFPKTNGQRFSQGSESRASEREIALAIARDAANATPAPTSEPSPIIAVNSISDNSTAMPNLGRMHALVELHNFHPPPINEAGRSRTPESLTIYDASIQNGLRMSLSTPTITQQLSHKLSQTFGNPTIVHRPNMRTRPSLLSTQDVIVGAETLEKRAAEAQDSTSPSSYTYSGFTSATEPSTGKTSLESNQASQRSLKSHDGQDGAIEAVRPDLISRESALTPIQEIPLVTSPTLITAESTANAKIFFETHFNSLLAGHASPRSLRRRRLELKMEAHFLSEEQRDCERMMWASRESDHLRATRILKSRINDRKPLSKLEIAGYQGVRVLGKGSFGVVRLVREKESSLLGSSTEALVAQPNQSHRPPSKGEASGIKASAVEAFKSTFELHRPSQRQISAKSPKEVYAMKVIRKSDMLRNCQEGHLRAERDFLVASEHSRWVVPLVASFQDHTNLYLVMEYMVGGDFLGLLFRKNILKEKHARWYIAEMILCVEETHRSKWIHRDIKPDNFLISSSGHLKISDFGLAFDGHWAHDQKYFKSHRTSLMDHLGIKVKGDKDDQEEDEKEKSRSHLASILAGGNKEPPNVKQFDGPGENETILQWRNRNGKRRMAASIVGTSQYMAPEVIRGDAYDGRCDWWSIGVILYECLYGFTPFVCENREDTKAKILDNANSLIFPTEREVDRKEKISYEAMELINSLLQEKEHRLSSKKYRWNDWQHSARTPGQLLARRSDPHARDYQGNFVYPDDATDIKSHQFFARIAWDRLHLTRPPFVPDVKSCDDTKYFDEEDPISDVDDDSSQFDDDENMSERTKANAEPSPTDLRAQSPWLKPALLQQQHGDEKKVVDHVLNRKDHATTAVASPTRTPPPPPPPARVAAGGGGGTTTRSAKSKKKNRKRPRDRVLRDKELGKVALDLRKRGAFLGYTYRRPRITFSLEDEKGRGGGAGIYQHQYATAAGNGNGINGNGGMGSGAASGNLVVPRRKLIPSFE